jgi:hypothetical protein
MSRSHAVDAGRGLPGAQAFENEQQRVAIVFAPVWRFIGGAKTGQVLRKFWLQGRRIT